MPIEIKELVIKTTIEKSIEDPLFPAEKANKEQDEQWKRITRWCKRYIDKKLQESKQR
ncbi:MAG: DUF5908 family protein [Cytophagales bacterium]|nr:DUF5908 family protein [Cytophagales bacterium]